jgi:hypothetical protein
MKRDEMLTSDELMPIYGSREHLLECSQLQGAFGGFRVLDDDDDFDFYLLTKGPDGKPISGPSRFWYFSASPVSSAPPEKLPWIYLWMLILSVLSWLGGYQVGQTDAQKEFQNQAFKGVEIVELQ